jgi:hypothetical protein
LYIYIANGEPNLLGIHFIVSDSLAEMRGFLFYLYPMNTLRYIYRKYSDAWGLVVLSALIYITIVGLRNFYDIETPIVGGDFFVSLEYRLFEVMCGSLFAFLALKFNFTKTLGAYYFKHQEDGKSDFRKDWEASTYSKEGLWRITIFLSAYFLLLFAFLVATVGA